ncbi:MAG: DUF2520 domain-containing protein [Chitinophagaceae bacterium]|nr:DUF2520 domain-containing protein [Chitinophagaceae bacterium]
MKICLLGSGNTATVLGHLSKKAGHEVLQVFGRNKDTTQNLADSLGCNAAFSWEDVMKDADIYIIALPDTVLPTVYQNLQLKKGIAVHTAGSVSIDVLKGVCQNYGVLYPLQSLRASEKQSPDIPFLIDGNTVEDKTLLMDFASGLSPMVSLANDEQRLNLHLAAVWVNNFSNHLFTLAWEFCNQNGADFKMLLPLMEHTVGRLHFSSPPSVQTGPAIRGDFATIEKHLGVLAGKPEMAALYRQLSDAIISYYARAKKNGGPA